MCQFKIKLNSLSKNLRMTEGYDLLNRPDGFLYNTDVNGEIENILRPLNIE